MDFAEIKESVSMLDLLGKLGIPIDKQKRCACPLHGGDNKTAFSVYDHDRKWKCHTDCDTSGDIFDFIQKYEGLTGKAVQDRILELFNLAAPAVKPKKKPATLEVISEKVHVYRGTDGHMLFEMIRKDYNDGSKKFTPRKDGKYALAHEERELYNLDRIHEVASLGHNTSEYVVLCEGEKTADALTHAGFVATTNPFGSGDWHTRYADTLEGLNVVVFHDADKKGVELKDQILLSLAHKANSVRVIRVSEKFVESTPQYRGHDFADMVEVGGEDRATQWLVEAIANAVVMPNGIDPSVNQTPRTLFRAFKQRVESGNHTECFNINSWIPSMNYSVYHGDLLVMMANTSVGKSRLLQNIPFNIRNRNFAIFDLELSLDVLTMRYVAMENDMSFSKAMHFLNNRTELKEPTVDHVNIQKVQRITVDRVRQRVEEIEAITKKRIDIIAIDYIGLMGGSGTVYERTSTNVEEFKAYITETNRVGILTTQCARKGNDGRYECPSLHDAKNSGSVENSGQEVIAFWLDDYDESKMYARVLKYSHGNKSMADVELLANQLKITEAI